MEISIIKKDLYDWISNVKNEDFKEMDKVNLFSSSWKLYPRDIVYLFLYIKNKYNVIIPPDFINDIEFFTIDNISERIFSQLNSIC